MEQETALTREEKIIGFMTEQAYRPMLRTEIALMLDVPPSEQNTFFALLDGLEAKGRICRTKNERYGIPKRMNLVTGRLQGHERGFGFVVPDEGEDVYIASDAMNGAMHGDTVIARFVSGPAGGSRSGEIVQVLERANTHVIGTYEAGRRSGFVVPDQGRIKGDILIPPGDSMNAEDGQKVVAELVSWPGAHRGAEGRIVEILGHPGEKGVDVLSIIRAYNIPVQFPPAVLAEAELAPPVVLPENMAGRSDLRELRMVTIDGEDARDLDDAVSLECLENGAMRLGVHIADVTNYVVEGSALDDEAVRRGTSVYFPDRVVPMLPHALSNGICSLNAHEDRLAMTVFMHVDANGATIHHEICESVIRVRERMTYTQVFQILEQGDPELLTRYADLVPMFHDMRKLAVILKEKRMRRGAVDFLFDETKVIVDDAGHTAEIKRYSNTIANGIIEEFMLLCNEVVSEHFFRLDIPFVYRIHEDPSPEKIRHLQVFLRFFGYSLSGGDEVHPSALQKVLDQVRGKPEEKAIGMVMLRSLQKARYSHEHVWHFGLAAEFYSHFTSPIRRYPDLIIHRIIKESLRGKLSPKRIAHYRQLLPSIAKSSSERERAAADAERDVVDMKKAEYMSAFTGESFDGIISSVAGFGFFVELENTVEGLVRVNTLEDDYYLFDEELLLLTGEHTRRQFRIGDRVRVRLVRADPQSRQIDFLLEVEAGSTGKTSAGRKAGASTRTGSTGRSGARTDGRFVPKSGNTPKPRSGRTDGTLKPKSGRTDGTLKPKPGPMDGQRSTTVGEERVKRSASHSEVSAAPAKSGNRRNPIDPKLLAHIGTKKSKGRGTAEDRKPKNAKKGKKGSGGNSSRW